MALSSCIQKHRNMALYRRAVRRGLLARKRHAHMAPASLPSTKEESDNVPSSPISTTAVDMQSDHSEEAAAVVPAPPLTRTSAIEDPSSTWGGMLWSLVAMFQPAPSQITIEKPADPKHEVLTEAQVPCIPSEASEVVQGSRREKFWRCDMDSYAANRQNEDRMQSIRDEFVILDGEKQTPVFFTGCYDGHGGDQAVDYVCRNLYDNIKSHLTNNQVTSISDAIIKGFEVTDEQFHDSSRRQFQEGTWNACSAGSCAVIAMIIGTKLFIAGCGDCRAIVGVRDESYRITAQQITRDHSANEASEQEKLRLLFPEDHDILRSIGNDTFYVKGRLQPTRTIGDTYLKFSDVNQSPMPKALRIQGSFSQSYISSTPDVFEVDLRGRDRPEFVVLGSDGLFGELDNNEVAKQVYKYRKEGYANAALALRKLALTKAAAACGMGVKEFVNILPGFRRDYHDDITASVLHLKEPRRQVAQGAKAA